MPLLVVLEQSWGLNHDTWYFRGEQTHSGTGKSVGAGDIDGGASVGAGDGGVGGGG
jgi:hypothetical protein